MNVLLEGLREVADELVVHVHYVEEHVVTDQGSFGFDYQINNPTKAHLILKQSLRLIANLRLQINSLHPRRNLLNITTSRTHTRTLRRYRLWILHSSSTTVILFLAIVEVWFQLELGADVFSVLLYFEFCF